MPYTRSDRSAATTFPGVVRRGVAALAAGGLLVGFGFGAGPAQAAPSVAGPLQASPAQILPKSAKSAKIAPRLAADKATRKAVYVQLSGSSAGAASVSASSAGKSKTAVKAAGRQRRAAAGKTADAVLKAARTADGKARQLYRTSNAMPGIALMTDDKAIESLAGRSDVIKISSIVPKTTKNASSAQVTKTLQAWSDAGTIGKGIKIGVIDTGIDYTHADFGGPGTVAAFDAATDSDTFKPTAKVKGGYDFVGDDYNADPTADSYSPVPVPDPNPLDCNGHGSHVSGSAAGYGVTAAGKTFTGNPANLTPTRLDSMQIGPGMAPGADLYALRVFGCDGSTDAVGAAIDWAVDPNGDGDVSDHLDIINLSLGSAFGAADDPDAQLMNAAAKLGVLPVTSAGNSGDLTDAGGSPGNAVRTLAVASSVDPGELLDGIKVDAPSALAGVAPGQASIEYPWDEKDPVTGTVTPLSAANADGCTALSAADAAAVEGKVAWLTWDSNDATRKCGSVARADNIEAAGGLGVLLTSTVFPFTAGISGNDAIPMFQLTPDETARLAASATASTLEVTFDAALLKSITLDVPAQTDTLSEFSSRGSRGAPGGAKPDIAAPGQTITSAAVGTGNGRLNISGTSMASPMMAGISALVLSMHQTWTVAQVKAAVMNTAVHDVYTEDNHKGTAYGPLRVGSGRADAPYAVSTSLLAYAAGGGGGVSLSFGVVEAPAGQGVVSRTKLMTVQNTSTKDARVAVSYSPAVKQPGVSYSVSPKSVTVKAKSKTYVSVTMTADPRALRRTIDPTMATEQINALTGEAEARTFVSDASGRVLVKPAGKTALRVPVYGAAKPVSETTAVAATVGGTKVIGLLGSGVSQGAQGSDYTSKASVLDLGYVSPKLPPCVGTATVGCTSLAITKAADLQYAGASAVPNDDGNKSLGLLWFGVSTFGNWSATGNIHQVEVAVDVDGDKVADYYVFNQNLPDTDLLEAVTVDAAGNPLAIAPVNAQYGDEDGNVFDTSTLLLPTVPAALGMTAEAKTFPISYRVTTYAEGAPEATGGAMDSTPWVSFDAANPLVQTASPLYPDRNNVAIPYTTPATTTVAATVRKADVSAAAATGSVKALVLHLNGQSGKRAQVLDLPVTS